MPRPLLIRSKDLPYHVTARANNREHFHLKLDHVWAICTEHLNSLEKDFGTRVHAFVLMPNHFHLIISTPEDDLGVATQWLMSALTRRINLESKRCGRVFGWKYYRTIIDTSNYYDLVLKYVFRNPVKAGLCSSVSEYPYSTIRQNLGGIAEGPKIHPYPLEGGLLPFGTTWDFVDWLNRPFQNEFERKIKSSLTKARFGDPKLIGKLNKQQMPDA